ncbi:unnamed protein product [Effrenium voratum]|uniref:Major facilitator superfamily (MFS) profile domain-containing protein n=1 Tax=Effrenium voratum TaxID=2562239 RepID=A0AA36N200_9DINO|nr:unnamed protein product [Effrenium voratum]
MEWTSRASLALLVLGLCLFLPAAACRGLPRGGLRTQEKTGMSKNMNLALATTMLLDYSCTDQYQPSMPQMAEVFQVSPSAMGYTIQVHLLSCAAGTLMVGPLSDRMGRRPVILACQSMLAVSTFACMCASDLLWFMAGRVLQGLAASVYVVILASLRDCYADPGARLRAMGTLMSLMLVGPIFAPSMGGLLASYAGWRCPFLVLALLSLSLTLFSVFVLEETAVAPKTSEGYLRDIYRVVRDRRRVMILLCVGTTKSLFDVVISSNGFILEDTYGQSVRGAARIAAAFAISCALGSLLARRLHRRPTEVLLLFIPILLGAAGLLVLGACFSESLGWYVSVICILQLLVFPPIIAYHAEFTEELQDIAGVATSVALCAQYLLSSLISLPGVVLAESGVRGMLFFLAGVVVVTELITWFLRPAVSVKEEDEEDEEETEEETKEETKEETEEEEEDEEGDDGRGRGGGDGGG